VCFEWAKTKSQSKLSHEPFGISVCTWSHMYFLHTYILLGFPCSWRGRTTLHSTACVSGRLAEQQQLAPLLTILFCRSRKLLHLCMRGSGSNFIRIWEESTTINSSRVKVYQVHCTWFGEYRKDDVWCILGYAAVSIEMEISLEKTISSTFSWTLLTLMIPGDWSLQSQGSGNCFQWSYYLLMWFLYKEDFLH
jgi:hypothetical protein